MKVLPYESPNLIYRQHDQVQPNPFLSILLCSSSTNRLNSSYGSNFSPSQFVQESPRITSKEKDYLHPSLIFQPVIDNRRRTTPSKKSLAFRARDQNHSRLENQSFVRAHSGR